MKQDEETAVLIPVLPEDLLEIQRLLKEHDVFTTTFRKLGDAQYEAGTYLSEQLSAGTEIVFRLDRNLFTRIIDLAQGRKATIHHRIAAAVQAFAQTLKIGLEPNLALYEVAASAGDANPNKELLLFRRIDNSHPQHLADIAVGRCDSLKSHQLAEMPSHRTNIDFSNSLTRWEASYIAVLKIAVLELAGGPAEEKLTTLLKWMKTDYLFIAPAIFLANHYWGPNGRRAGLLKSLRSPNRTKAFNGIRNATWDLALIYEWGNDAANQPNQYSLHILASMDRKLHQIARSFVIAADHHDPIDALLQTEFILFWGSSSGTRIFERYLECTEQISKTPRMDRTIAPDKAISLTRELESAVQGYQD
jgi:hypothetical protein